MVQWFLIKDVPYSVLFNKQGLTQKIPPVVDIDSSFDEGAFVNAGRSTLVKKAAPTITERNDSSSSEQQCRGARAPVKI